MNVSFGPGEPAYDVLQEAAGDVDAEVLVFLGVVARVSVQDRPLAYSVYMSFGPGEPAYDVLPAAAEDVEARYSWSWCCLATQLYGKDEMEIHVVEMYIPSIGLEAVFDFSRP